MFILRESQNPHILFFADGETIARCKTLDEAENTLKEHAKKVEYVAFVRVVNTETLAEFYYTWDANGNLKKA